MDVTTCMMVKGQELQCVCVCLLGRLGGGGLFSRFMWLPHIISEVKDSILASFTHQYTEE